MRAPVSRSGRAARAPVSRSGRAARALRGSNVVEFALILPVLLMLITGIIDFGWATAVRTIAVSAARTGARAGALTAQADGPDGIAVTAAADKWRSVGLPLTPTIVAFRTGTPELMVVRVRIDLATLIGFVLGPQTLEITSVQRMEDQP
ncbi:MAG: pilus assembly protein [Myxococcota bacterium]